jgi:hypothetical protein
MHPYARTLAAVLLSGLIVWLIITSSVSMFYVLHWWGFLFILGMTFLVVDATLQAVQEKITGTH